jgi:ABC-2 type transport system ATP-binding protein
VGTALEFSGLTKRFGTTVAVDDLTASISEGRVTGFLGPNGAGKTTALRVLLGLVAPTSGTATVGGRRYAELTDPARKVGTLLEATGFHPSRKARDHLRVLATAAGVPQVEVDRALDFVGLSTAADRAVGGYSMGMRQRLGLAAALLGDPPVLVLDEPANGLDPEGIRWLRALLRGLAAEGRTVLVSSHVLAEVEQTADDVLVLAAGRLVATGSLETLRSEAGGGGTEVRSPDAERLAGLLRGEGMGVTPAGDGVLVVDGPAARIGEVAAGAGVVLHGLTERRTGLEDLFFRLTGAPPAPAAIAAEVPR